MKTIKIVIFIIIMSAVLIVIPIIYPENDNFVLLGFIGGIIITNIFKWDFFKKEAIKFLLRNLRSKGIKLKRKLFFIENKKSKIELYQKILEQFPNYNKKLQGDTTEQKIYELAVIIYFKNKFTAENITT